jgi:hypothetical protein
LTWNPEKPLPRSLWSGHFSHEFTNGRSPGHSNPKITFRTSEKVRWFVGPAIRCLQVDGGDGRRKKHGHAVLGIRREDRSTKKKIIWLQSFRACQIVVKRIQKWDKMVCSRHFLQRPWAVHSVHMRSSYQSRHTTLVVIMCINFTMFFYQSFWPIFIHIYQ